MAGDELLGLVTVVIPTRDEVKGIGLVLDEVLSVGVPRERVLVVDGGSTDGTVDVAVRYGVRVVQQEGRGKADAIWTALKYVNTPYMLVMDGDYSYPARYIPEMVREVMRTGADEVIGVRKPLPCSQGPIYRLGNRLLTWVFNLLFDTKLHDVLSGMYIVRVESLRDAVAEVGGFSIEAHIAAHMISTGRVVREIPIEYRPRVGKKKLGVVDGLRIFRDMVLLTTRYNPMLILFLLGALLLIPGFSSALCRLLVHILRH
ncbi:glycosyltransferase family 2 protein [Vulcanisaeta sp. JCM 16161]|uniref:glycosyltransferase family 2 protein n=1 Tax=Vulcanisaeta sp. JCM 16161 TaxID=1295372 RepID=UPI000A47C22B|nr:glycosyltransferase family 2 protein [Vulcanisaeta sp. JCM 16161]